MFVGQVKCQEVDQGWRARQSRPNYRDPLDTDNLALELQTGSIVVLF
jgi:hypothetical protein